MYELEKVKGKRQKGNPNALVFTYFPFLLATPGLLDSLPAYCFSDHSFFAFFYFFSFYLRSNPPAREYPTLRARSTADSKICWNCA